MFPRITSMENLIATDPGGRNVFGLVIGDQLRLAAQSLRLGQRVGIVSGFFIPSAGAGETDGPPGAVAIGRALEQLGIKVDYITDRLNAPIFQSLGLRPMTDLVPHPGAAPGPFTHLVNYLDRIAPTHLVSIERVGRGRDGRYRNMRGENISGFTAPLDELFLEAARRGITTIGIGDGGNEIGMGKVFADTLATIPHGREIASVVPTDFCIAAGVSNWGGYGLAGALSVLAGRDLLATPGECIETVETIVRAGGAVDGRTHRREATVDGLPLSASLRMLEDIRSLIAPSPLERAGPLVVGIIGFGETGRAAARLLTARGHRVRVSDLAEKELETGTATQLGGAEGEPGAGRKRAVAPGGSAGELHLDGIETGEHTPEFFASCDLVVASPGVRPDSPIRNELHVRGIPVMSELEMAYQLVDRPIVAVTGTIGKRSTVEMMQRFFHAAGRRLDIGGNKGLPLSALLMEPPLHVDSAAWAVEGTPLAQSPDCQLDDRPLAIDRSPLALAVSSFQLEAVVHFRPQVAVILNIDDAHLDRHRSIAEYIRIKSRIFMNHHPQDVLILPFDDERLRVLARKHHGRTFFMSRHQEMDRGAWLAGGCVHLNLEGAVESIPLGGLAGAPYFENLLAAVVAARLFGIELVDAAGCAG